MEDLEKLRSHLTHIQNIVDHIKRKHVKKLVVIPEVIDTPDGKKWLYDNKHHEWIEVTKPKGLKLENLKPL